MLGRVLNTHQQWICRRLADSGRPVTRQVAIADEGSAIEAAVREGLSRADLVITTGGLGPTSDDLTRERIAALLGLGLQQDAVTLHRIREFFATRHRSMPPSTEVQALIPAGATILENAHGTAPGLLLRVAPNPFRPDSIASWLLMLPGPPRELHPMFLTQVLPWVEQTFPLGCPQALVTLRTTGLGESQIEERIAPGLEPLMRRGLAVGYCARTGEVDVRLVATQLDAGSLVREGEDRVRAELGGAIYGVGDESLEEVVVRQLAAQGLTLAVAESSTGGFVANRITQVPGASQVFLGGIICYSNASKVRDLDVPPETLEAHGAVSEAVASALAEGARKRFGAGAALAITGIAGPGGGTAAKPVGTVHIALSLPSGTTVEHRLNPFDRETFKFITSQQALNLLRLHTQP